MEKVQTHGGYQLRTHKTQRSSRSRSEQNVQFDCWLAGRRIRSTGLWWQRINCNCWFRKKPLKKVTALCSLCLSVNTFWSGWTDLIKKALFCWLLLPFLFELKKAAVVLKWLAGVVAKGKSGRGLFEGRAAATRQDKCVSFRRRAPATGGFRVGWRFRAEQPGKRPDFFLFFTEQLNTTYERVIIAHLWLFVLRARISRTNPVNSQGFSVTNTSAIMHWPNSLKLDQEYLIDTASYVQRLKMYPHFDIAHYILVS